MKVNGIQTRAIWFDDSSQKIKIIDQRLLPFEYQIIELHSVQETFEAIKNMAVRGAPVIGASAAYGMFLAFKESTNHNFLKEQANFLKSARPTAVNLMFAVDWMMEKMSTNSQTEEVLNLAQQYAEKDIEDCLKIGQFGTELIEDIYKKKPETVNILTHCNAGWLATGEYGTATAPIYLAHEKGIPVHVWVDETRPRNQGANLTAWELQQHGIPYTIIADNTGGHLMQHQMVDICIVGSDRTTANGDVANKIGTYLKALAAHDNNIPFYVALPTSSIDPNISNGLTEITIEERNSEELSHISGIDEKGILKTVRIYQEQASTANYAFDVTPAKYVTGLITEKGIIEAQRGAILKLFK